MMLTLLSRYRWTAAWVAWIAYCTVVFQLYGGAR